MVKKLAIAKLKAHLSEVLRAVENGERVAIERRGKTIAFLVPASEETNRPGDWLDEIHGVAADIDDFDRIMKDTVRSRAASKPRPVNLED